MAKLKVEDTIHLSPVLHDIEDCVQDEWNRVAPHRAISEADLIHAVTLVSEDATVGIAKRYFFQTTPIHLLILVIFCLFMFSYAVDRVVNVALRNVDREKAEVTQV